MKTFWSTLFFVFCALGLTAQTFIADEFIVEYVENATEADKDAVRAFYNVTDYDELGENVELWQNIPFPITITENGFNTVIEDVIELNVDIQIELL